MTTATTCSILTVHRVPHHIPVGWVGSSASNYGGRAPKGWEWRCQRVMRTSHETGLCWESRNCWIFSPWHPEFHWPRAKRHATHAGAGPLKASELGCENWRCVSADQWLVELSTGWWSTTYQHESQADEAGGHRISGGGVKSVGLKLSWLNVKTIMPEHPLLVTELKNISIYNKVTLLGPQSYQSLFMAASLGYLW